MATKTTYTYVSLANLQEYDGLIKSYIGDQITEGVKKSLKSVAIDGYTLKFYTEEAPTETTSPAFSIEIPEVDLTQIKADIAANKAAIDVLNGDETVEGSVKKAVKDATTAGTVTIDTTTTTTGMLKSYTVKQGDTQVGVIDIPKDMVVKSGEVVVNPEGQAEGTYIVLTLANAAEDKVYVNVGTLVDIYTAQASATQVQLTINSSTREISAVIVDGSVGTAALTDKGVTKAKLSDALQASIDKADTAIQEADLTELRATVAANTTAASKAQAAADAAQADVDALEVRVEKLESVDYKAATTEEINALFA